jgi:hypothetical protein
MIFKTKTNKPVETEQTQQTSVPLNLDLDQVPAATRFGIFGGR